MPLKIEIKNLGNNLIPNEEIGVGFTHDIIKNIFIVEAIKDELTTSGNCKLLSAKCIISPSDRELFLFFIDYI